MKPSKFLPLSLAFLLLLSFVLIGTLSYADYSPNEILMKATKLNYTFTSEQQTRWGSGGPLKEEGPILTHVTFDSINHEKGEAKITSDEGYSKIDLIPGRIRKFGHSITFFELTTAGELDPVVTTVLDDYYGATNKFIAVRSVHITSAFNRALALQKLATCIPGKWYENLVP